MESDHSSIFPVSYVENRSNLKKNVSFNLQSNVLYFDKEQSSSFLEGMDANNFSTFPDFPVKNSKNINSNNQSDVFYNAESETPFPDDVDHEQSKLNVVEKPYMLLKNLVINLEKLPLNILNKFNCENHVCGEDSKNVFLKKPKAKIFPDSVQCINQNGDIHTHQTVNPQNLKYDKNIVQTIASDSLLTKNNTFRELRVCLQLLPDNFLTLDKNFINLQNSKQIISSSSVKPANNQCSVQSSLKQPKHKVSKSNHKMLKLKKKLLKRSKQNIKHFENKMRCDSFISLDSVPINSEEGIVMPKSPDHDQDDKMRGALCTETERFNTSFDVHPLSSDHINTSAISNIPSKSAKPTEISDITTSCTSSSVRLSLLQDCIKEVSSDTETSMNYSGNNLTNSVTKNVNSTENQNLLTKDESDYHNYCNISFKKPVVVLERLNLVMPEIECEEMNVQTTEKDNLEMENNSHSQSTSGKVQRSSKKNAKPKSSFQKEFKILKKKKKIENNFAPSKFGSRDLSVNNFCVNDVPLLLFTNNNHLKKKKDSNFKKKIKNNSKPFKTTKKYSKFDSKVLPMDNLSSKFDSMNLSLNNLSKDFEEDLPLASFANNNNVKKQHYFDFKKMTKNKSKSFKKAKKFSSVDISWEDDVPLFLFANDTYKKKQNNFASKKIKNNKFKDKNPASNLKSITMDHNYFSAPSSMYVQIDSGLSVSSPLTNIEMDHNYVSCITNNVHSHEMSPNHINVPSKFPKKSKKENSEKKIECPTCKKMDSPHIFLKTYLNKFCSSFDNLGKEKSLLNVDQKKQSDTHTAIKNQEYGYNYIINKLHTHLKVTCSVKKSYKKQRSRNVKSASLNSSENNIPQFTNFQLSSKNDSYTSLLHTETANEDNNYDLSEMLFAAKRSSNNQHRSKSHVDKYRLGFLAANNPLRLYNKCLASERFLLSKYEMTNGQRKKIKKMFSSLKNNAAAIEKIE